MISNTPSGSFTFIMIALGVIVFLIIKISSDVSVSNRQLHLGIGNYCTKIKPEYETRFKFLLDRTQRDNDHDFIIKEMPIRTKEIYFESEGDKHAYALTYNDSAIDAGIMKSFVNSNSIGFVWKDIICVKGSDDYNAALSARVIYDKALNDGGFNLEDVSNITDFLAVNGIVPPEFLNIDVLKTASLQKPILIPYLSYNSRRSNNYQMFLFRRGNALLLQQCVNGYVGEMDC